MTEDRKIGRQEIRFDDGEILQIRKPRLNDLEPLGEEDLLHTDRLLYDIRRSEDIVSAEFTHICWDVTAMGDEFRKYYHTPYKAVIIIFREKDSGCLSVN